MNNHKYLIRDGFTDEKLLELGKQVDAAKAKEEKAYADWQAINRLARRELDEAMSAYEKARQHLVECEAKMKGRKIFLSRDS